MTEQPSAAPARAPNKSALIAAVGVVCAGICVPLVSNFESGGQQHLVAYHGKLDPPGVYTICDGDTLNVHAADVIISKRPEGPSRPSLDKEARDEPILP